MATAVVRAQDYGAATKHFYRQDWHGGGLLTHVRQIGDAIRAIADVAAAWTADRTALTISVVNPTFETQRLAFRGEGARLTSEGTAWVLAAEDDMAFNEPGKAPAVRFVETRVTGLQEALELAPASRAVAIWPPP